MSRAEPAREAVRVGVVGLGVMGRAHARVLDALTGVAVTAVADVAPQALDEYAGVARFTDPMALVTGADVDAVLVASPDASHAGLVLAAVRRGLPVLCEKPLTVTVTEAEQVIAAEAAAGRRLVQVGFMRRFDPAFAGVAAQAHGGGLGPTSVVRTVHRNPVSAYAFTPEVLVGNSASHDVDLVRWITGDEVASVWCTAAPGGDARAATVLLRLRTRGGVLADTELTYGPGCGYDVRCEVVGHDGVGTTPLLDPHGDWVDRFAQAYRAQDAAWVAWLRGGPALGADAFDALATTAVLEAAVRSLGLDGPVDVSVPPRPPHLR